jgi:hypothetical protein
MFAGVVEVLLFFTGRTREKMIAQLTRSAAQTLIDGIEMAIL